MPGDTSVNAFKDLSDALGLDLQNSPVAIGEDALRPVRLSGSSRKSRAKQAGDGEDLIYLLTE